MASMRQLRKVIKWLIPDKILYKHIVPFYKTITKSSTKKKKLLKFQINITDHCNLNCKGCTAFSPLAKEKFLDLNVFERDCSRISELTKGRIELVDLLGGEPLLHPDIIKITEISRRYFTTGDINIITNGILLTKMPLDFWQKCNEYKVNIIISGYPVKLNFSEINKMAQSNNVKLSIRGNPSGKKIWNKVPFDLQGTQNIVKNFKKCFGANFCICLDNGKLATCPMPLLIPVFNDYFKQNIPVTENDFIDIYKVNTIDDILDFLCKPIPICAYCNLENVEYGINWDSSKKEITEWI